MGRDKKTPILVHQAPRSDTQHWFRGRGGESALCHSYTPWAFIYPGPEKIHECIPWFLCAVLLGNRHCVACCVP